MFKLIAVLLMVLDHFAFYLYPLVSPQTQVLLRQVGRLAFPMFAYAVAMNIRRSKHLPKYFLRLLAVAMVTQFLFYLVQAYDYRIFTFVNVLFTLALGMAVIQGLHLIRDSSRDLLMSARPLTSDGTREQPGVELPTFAVNFGGITLPAWVGLLSGLVMLGSALYVVHLWSPDYGLYGIVMMVGFHFLDPILPADHGPERSRGMATRIAAFLIFMLLLNLANYAYYRSIGIEAQGTFQMASTFAPLLFGLENRPGQRRPGVVAKWFFYLFYPIHLVLFMLLSTRFM